MSECAFSNLNDVSSQSENENRLYSGPLHPWEFSSMWLCGITLCANITDHASSRTAAFIL